MSNIPWEERIPVEVLEELIKMEQAPRLYGDRPGGQVIPDRTMEIAQHEMRRWQTP